MQIFLTLDYELFSGSNPGTVENTILLPTRKLLEVADRYDAKFVFYVDSGYLERLKTYCDRYPQARADYDAVTEQIRMLDAQGHDIELHIHPHWEDCTYDEEGWHMDTSRFRIHSFTQAQIEEIVYRYKKALTDIVGEKVFAYRAGGWCLQPFAKLGPALKKNGIWLDSTVYEEGLNSSQTHYYDFRGMPKRVSTDSRPIRSKRILKGTLPRYRSPHAKSRHSSSGDLPIPKSSVKMPTKSMPTVSVRAAHPTVRCCAC